MTDAVKWEKVLSDASQKAMNAVSRVASGSGRLQEIGVGAFGDRTLLADSEAEKVFLASLSNVPGVRVLSEEAGEVGDRKSMLTAVLDPLDGSSNFSRGIPFYCTSVAIVSGEELGGAMVAHVRNLVNGDVYYAEKGKGATKNNKLIKTSATKTLRDSVVSVDMSRAKPETIVALSSLVSEVKRQVHFGANALELCMLGEGVTDAFVDVRNSIRVVDFAAAYLITKEAGGIVTSPAGEELRVRLDMKERFNYVASANRELHDRVLARLAWG